jgi:hypothetical protein
MRSQPIEEGGNWDQQSAAEAASRKLSSSCGVVRGRPSQVKEPGSLLNGQRRSAGKLIDAQLRIVLHVGTSFIGLGRAPGWSHTAGAAFGLT